MRFAVPVVAAILAFTLAGCPQAIHAEQEPDAGSVATPALRVTGSVSSGGGSASAGTRRVTGAGLERQGRACAGERCVEGGITP